MNEKADELWTFSWIFDDEDDRAMIAITTTVANTSIKKTANTDKFTEGGGNNATYWCQFQHSDMDFYQ